MADSFAYYLCISSPAGLGYWSAQSTSQEHTNKQLLKNTFFNKEAVMSKLINFFSIVFLFILTFSPSVTAWDIPEKVWVNHSMPPAYWLKTGSLIHQNRCSIQRYDLFSAGGTPQNIFRMAVICPNQEKFCIKVLPNNQQIGVLPLECIRSVPENAVNIAVSSFLYTSGDKR